MTAQKTIEGKVAALLNDREIAINRGIAHGVKVGMRFKVLSSAAAKIIDPETGDEIGEVTYPKARVRVKSVQERFSIASTYKEKMVNVGGTGAGVAVTRIFEPPKWETRVEKLPLGEQTVADLVKQGVYVQTGDAVLQETSGHNETDID